MKPPKRLFSRRCGYNPLTKEGAKIKVICSVCDHTCDKRQVHKANRRLKIKIIEEQMSR